MKKVYLVISFVLLVRCLNGQGWSGAIATDAAGMSLDGVSLPGLWSGFVNPAGLAVDGRLAAGAAVANHLGLIPLTRKDVAVSLPAAGGVFALSGSHFGDALYSEQRYNLAFGKRLGSAFYAGISMDYCLLAQGGGYGSAGGFTFGAGLLAAVTPELQVGAYVFNPPRASLAAGLQSDLPLIMRLGLSYIFSAELLASAEVVKDSEHSPTLQAGLQYNFRKQFFLRGGVSTDPGSYAFGIGFRSNRLVFDLSGRMQTGFGIGPGIGLQYFFR